MRFCSHTSSDVRGISYCHWASAWLPAPETWSLSCSCHLSKSASSKVIASCQDKEYPQILSNFFFALVWIQDCIRQPFSLLGHWRDQIFSPNLCFLMHSYSMSSALIFTLMVGEGENNCPPNVHFILFSFIGLCIILSWKYYNCIYI